MRLGLGLEVIQASAVLHFCLAIAFPCVGPSDMPKHKHCLMDNPRPVSHSHTHMLYFPITVVRLSLVFPLDNHSSAIGLITDDASCSHSTKCSFELGLGL